MCLSVSLFQGPKEIVFVEVHSSTCVPMALELVTWKCACVHCFASWDGEYHLRVALILLCH